MKYISILSNILKIKLFIWVLILFCLIGLLVILNYYKYINVFENTVFENTAFENRLIEGFNTSAPLIEIKLINEPVRFAYFTGGGNWFHVNSLLFFDENGQLLQYGRDYTHYSTDGFGWWGAQNYNIVFNTNPDQKDTYYHSASTNCTFVTVFTHPQSDLPNKKNIFLSRIYIRNRLGANNSGGGFSQCSSSIHYRIQNYKLQLFSIGQQKDQSGRRGPWHYHQYSKNIFQNISQYRLGDDGNLMKGPNYDVIVNFLPYVDPAIEAKRKADEAAAAAQKTIDDAKEAKRLADEAAAIAAAIEAKRIADEAAAKAKKEAEEAEAARIAAQIAAEAKRQAGIQTKLTQVSAYEQSAKSSNENSVRFLQILQKNTTDTKFMTEPIILDVETSNAIKSDSITQVSRNDMDSNVNTTTKIANNLKNKENIIAGNLNTAMGLLKQIVVAHTNILENERFLSVINTELAQLNPLSSEQLATFNASRTNITTYKDNTNNNIIFANVSIDEIISSIRKIVSSKETVNANLQIVTEIQTMKENIMKMNDINKKENEAYINDLSKNEKGTSVFANSVATTLVL